MRWKPAAELIRIGACGFYNQGCKKCFKAEKNLRGPWKWDFENYLWLYLLPMTLGRFGAGSRQCLHQHSEGKQSYSRDFTGRSFKSSRFVKHFTSPHPSCSARPQGGSRGGQWPRGSGAIPPLLLRRAHRWQATYWWSLHQEESIVGGSKRDAARSIAVSYLWLSSCHLTPLSDVFYMH